MLILSLEGKGLIAAVVCPSFAPKKKNQKSSSKMQRLIERHFRGQTADSKDLVRDKDPLNLEFVEYNRTATAEV